MPFGINFQFLQSQYTLKSKSVLKAVGHAENHSSPAILQVVQTSVSLDHSSEAQDPYVLGIKIPQRLRLGMLVCLIWHGYALYCLRPQAHFLLF